MNKIQIFVLLKKKKKKKESIAKLQFLWFVSFSTVL